uniref:Putative nuclease HARBI1 isoform X2 n=1 Tax=Tanacetum cinerariifolium TaxID=118510 RepID=A0A6L2P1H1_TANCI|nr:putative nuclease HARBI1 isoform X2 [Tanacetum cinerariifolium]
MYSLLSFLFERFQLDVEDHISHPHCEELNRAAEPGQSSMSRDGSIFVYNPDVLHEQFAGLVIQRGLPFNHFDDEQTTRVFQKHLQQKYNHVSRATLKRSNTKQIKYKNVHEAARKDVERAFAILKKKLVTIKIPTRPMALKNITDMMYTCIILHNMIGKDNKRAISPEFYPDEQHREDDPVRSQQEMLQVIRDIRNAKAHLALKADLV